MWSTWAIPIGVVSGIAVFWLALVGLLWVNKRDAITVGEAARLLPDIVRLIRRLAADPGTPRGVRIRLALLLGYLALPIDLVPDFIPIIGYADDAVIVALTLRSVARRAGPNALTTHWPGTADGLDAVHRLCGLHPLGRQPVEPPGDRSARP